MTNMNKDEKRQMLFDMHVHPENYTDEQIERLLADEDVKKFLHNMAMAKMAGKKAKPKKINVDKAWQEFVETHNNLSTKQKKTPSIYRNRIKIAASFTGIIFLSGIALAAVHIGWFKLTTTNKPTTEQTVKSKPSANDSLKVTTAEQKDTLNMKPVVFDNAELGTILTQMAEFYHVKVEYANANAQHVRLFFNWNKKNTLEQNVKILNTFDRIQIKYAEGTLKVE